MQTLKPCPFCGYALSIEEGVCPMSDAVDEDTGEWKFTGICCASCAVFLPAKTDDADTAEGVAAWNTRPAAPVEGLETKAWNCMYPTYGHFTLKEHEAKQAIEDCATVEALAPRSQAEVIIAAKVEKERLRFEGDLDKWMQIIGAGITGYQPEAYALMDMACQELVKLRADNAALTARVKELVTERDEALLGNRYAQLERMAAKRAEALETQLAAATNLLRRSRQSLKRAPYDLFVSLDTFLGDHVDGTKVIP